MSVLVYLFVYVLLEAGCDVLVDPARHRMSQCSDQQLHITVLGHGRPHCSNKNSQVRVNS